MPAPLSVDLRTRVVAAVAAGASCHRAAARSGMKVLARQPKHGRTWDNDGSCLRLRPEHRDHVWSYDFVEARTQDGRRFRMLNVVDELTRECLTIRVARKLEAIDVIDVLSDLFSLRWVLKHIRSDNGFEFIVKSVRAWIAALGAKIARIAPRRGRTATSRASTRGCGTNS